MSNDKIIMYDSPEAAQLVTVTGWRSSDGRFFGKDEKAARYSGCTHMKCECGNVMSRGYIRCDQCSSIKRRERYNAMPFKQWDCVSFVFDQNTDQYFQNSDDLEEYYNDHDILLSHTMLVLCEPNHLHEVETDYWSDIMPEDGDGELPKAVEEALKALNKVISEAKPVSWSEGKYRTRL